MLGVTVNVCHVFHNENHVRACFCPILVTCSNSWGSLTEQKAAGGFACAKLDLDMSR